MGDDEPDVGAAIERLYESGADWKRKAERYETALVLIASYKDKTLLGPEQDLENFYALGAANAFADLAALAQAALDGSDNAKRPTPHGMEEGE